MDIALNPGNVLQNYRSNSQKARVLTENWVASEMYCPCCLHKKIWAYPNNRKMSDFFCEECINEFQLKSSKKPFSKKMVGGDYNTTIDFIKKGMAPNFLTLQYCSEKLVVKNLTMIPKFFINLSILEKRQPLSDKAKRARWRGCNFLLDKLPREGRIPIIKQELIQPKTTVNKTWKKMFFLANKKPESKGWTSDVLKVVQEQDRVFSLRHIYK